MSAIPSALTAPIMQINLEGRVRNLSLAKRQGLRPIFEAIANSIDAIEETNTDGDVQIRILRDLSQQSLLEGDTGHIPFTPLKSAIRELALLRKIGKRSRSPTPS